MIFVPAVYKRPIQATETSYVVKNTWLLWKNSEFMQKIKKITFFFNFWRFWGENNAKNAFSAGLLTPKMPDTILVCVHIFRNCHQIGHKLWSWLAAMRHKKKKKKLRNFISSISTLIILKAVRYITVRHFRGKVLNGTNNFMNF